MIALELVQIALFFFFMYRGTKVAARTQWIPTIFTVGCLVVALPVLLFTVPSDICSQLQQVRRPLPHLIRKDAGGCHSRRSEP